MFDSFQEDDKLKVLSALVNKELTFGEAGAKILEYKQWETKKGEFLRGVCVDTWEEAQEKFPTFATRDRIMKFKDTSKEFMVIIQVATWLKDFQLSS